jgi:hypothetical protein
LQAAVLQASAVLPGLARAGIQALCEVQYAGTVIAVDRAKFPEPLRSAGAIRTRPVMVRCVHELVFPASHTSVATSRAKLSRGKNVLAKKRAVG